MARKRLQLTEAASKPAITESNSAEISYRYDAAEYTKGYSFTSEPGLSLTYPLKLAVNF